MIGCDTMDLIYKIKKPASIKDFCKEMNIPLKLVIVEKNKFMFKVGQELKTKDDTIRKGDTLTVSIQDEDIDDKIIPMSGTLDIIYEDAYVLIVNKPFNLPMMISKAHVGPTLANWIAFYYQSIGFVGRIHYQNRVDKEASGLVVVWKHRFVKYLVNLPEATPFRHEHQTIIEGILTQKNGCIDLPIGKRDEESGIREVKMDGEECQTEFKVIQEYSKHSLIKITNETGKTHQIRVHFDYFRYPIVGDTIYNKHAKKTDICMLYSSKVLFRHPITGNPLDIELAMPDQFRNFLKQPGI